MKRKISVAVKIILITAAILAVGLFALYEYKQTHRPPLPTGGNPDEGRMGGRDHSTHIATPSNETQSSAKPENSNAAEKLNDAAKPQDTRKK